MTHDLGRRGLLQRLALGVPAAIAAGAAPLAAAPAPAPPAPPPAERPVAAPRSRNLRFFNRDEAALVDALAARLVPADELGPGAKEAGVTRFIDGQLAGAWGSGDHFYRQGPFVPGTPQQGDQLSFTPAEMFRQGLAKLSAAAASRHGGRAFADLAPADQDALIAAMEAGDLDFSPVPSKAFFSALLDATMEGFFSDPMYGGNAGMAGWKLVGFPGAYASFSNEIERHGAVWTRPPVPIAEAPHTGMDAHGHMQPGPAGRPPAARGSAR